MPDSMTQIFRAGPPGAKRDLAVIGDGFASADQSAYNEYVSDVLMNEVFRRRGDYFYEDSQAFNVYRVNLISNDSGVTKHTYDADGNLIDKDEKDTALDTIFTGVWDRCWIENGPDTISRLNAAHLVGFLARRRIVRRRQIPGRGPLPPGRELPNAG